MKSLIIVWFFMLAISAFADSAHVVPVRNSDMKTEGYRVEVRDENGDTYMTSRTYDKYTKAKKVAKKFNDKQEEEE